jgi:PAS domain S-box-containing protein
MAAAAGASMEGNSTPPTRKAFMSNWSIRSNTRALAGAGISLVAILAVAVAAHFTIESVMDTTLRTRDAFDIVVASERLVADFSEALAFQTAYVTSRDTRDLLARNKARNRIVTAIRSLSQTPNGASETGVAALRNALTRELAELDELLAVSLQQTAPEAREAQLTALIAHGRISRPQTRAAIETVTKAQAIRLENSVDAARDATRISYGIVAAVGAFFLLMAAVILRQNFKDLRQRESIEERLHETNGMLDSLLEHIPAMVFAKEAQELRFMHFNRAGEELIGYARADLLGKSDRDLFPAAQADFFIAKDREVLRQGTALDIPEEEIDTRLQGRRILHTRKVPIFDAQGRPSMLLGISMDITEQKLAERAVLDLNAELEQKAALLLAANEDLEGFCYSVSHDLRAPLRAINGYARVLQEDYASVLDENAERLLRGIRNNSRHMGDLIDDLLEFSRVGRQTLNIVPVDMTQLANRAAAELTSGCNGAAPTIDIGPLANTLGDTRALYRVWLNLLDNAFKYSSHSEAPQIAAWAESSNREVIYSVRDNGVGFDMQYYDKLFGVFERLHSAQEYPGTGVGLAIVKRVVVRHGGRVWAESQPGHGATFHFALPVVMA